MPDDPGFLPFDDDAQTPPGVFPPAPRTLGDPHFAYIGRALTLAEFEAYVKTYDFGPVPPDFIVLHHTAVPFLSYAPFPGANPADAWDAREAGMSLANVRAKRIRQLDGIRNYYRDSKHWNAGPHIFVDDKWIYLFTPMYNVGIHAAEGNGWRDRTGLHYSVGIEVVGYYQNVVWSAPVAANVGGAVRALLGRLPAIKPQYKRGPGGICSHRDWNKPACPGAAITTKYYIDVINATPTPVQGCYRVKAAVTAGAAVRSGPSKLKPVVDHLQAGARWEGGEVHGQKVTLAGFGSGDVWICDARGYCVWANLLEAE